jgi:hypothetical protein
VLAHRSSDTLYAYSDGSLPDSQRPEVDAHLKVCTACQDRVQEIQRLDLLLKDFPPAPAIAFPRFWSKLEGRLPNRAEKRSPFFRPRQLAAGFALAIVASLVGVVALASDETMPDSPLYSVKHVRQDLQLSLTSGRGRSHFELSLGKQRAHEASVMLKRRRDDLAVVSLRDLRALLADAAPQLGKSPSSQSDTAELKSAIAEIKKELTDVSASNAEPDGSTAPEMDAVDNAVYDAQAAVTQVETEVDATPSVTESPSPSPVGASPSAEAPTVAAPNESPLPEASLAPNEPAPTDVAASPAP